MGALAGLELVLPRTRCHPGLDPGPISTSRHRRKAVVRYPHRKLSGELPGAGMVRRPGHTSQDGPRLKAGVTSGVGRAWGALAAFALILTRARCHPGLDPGPISRSRYGRKVSVRHPPPNRPIEISSHGLLT